MTKIFILDRSMSLTPDILKKLPKTIKCVAIRDENGVKELAVKIDNKWVSVVGKLMGSFHSFTDKELCEYYNSVMRAFFLKGLVMFANTVEDIVLHANYYGIKDIDVKFISELKGCNTKPVSRKPTARKTTARKTRRV